MAMEVDENLQSLLSELRTEFREEHQRLESQLMSEREERLASVAEIRKSVDTVGASIVEGLTILGSEVESIIALVVHLKNSQAPTTADPADSTSDANETNDPISPRSLDRRRMMDSFNQLGHQLMHGCRSQMAVELRRASKDLQSSIAAMESKMRAELQIKLDDAVKTCMADKQADSKQEEEEIAASPSSRAEATSVSIDFGSDLPEEDMVSPSSARSILQTSPLDLAESRSILHEDVEETGPAKASMGSLVPETSGCDDASRESEDQTRASGAGASTAEEVSTDTSTPAEAAPKMSITLPSQEDLLKLKAELGVCETSPLAALSPGASPRRMSSPIQIGSRMPPYMAEAAGSPRTIPLPGMTPDTARRQQTYQVPLPVALPGAAGPALAIRTVSPQRVQLRPASVNRQPGTAARPPPWGIKGPPSSSHLRASVAPQVSSPYLSTTLADARNMPQKEQEAARLGAMRLAVAQSRASPPPASARRGSGTRLEI